MVARAAGADEILLFHCISAYPAPIEESNLLSIPYLRDKFGVEVGLSDHTLGVDAAVIATSLGAVAIEKHFTLDRSDGGPDGDFSIEPDELKAMRGSVDLTLRALGQEGIKRSEVERQSSSIRKSIYFINNLKKGAVIKENDIKVIRPSNGVHPKYFDDLIGSTEEL